MTQASDVRSRDAEAAPKFVFDFSEGDKDQKDLLGGKGAVKGFLLVSPARDGATGAALERLAAKQHKPTLHLSLDAAAQDWPELEAFRDRVTLGTAAGTTVGEGGA